jgi:hypothetical protein
MRETTLTAMGLLPIYNVSASPSKLTAQFMKRIHVRSLADAELRPELEAGNTIYFLGKLSLQKIESQVERLGFGERYITCATRRQNDDRAKIRLSPDHSTN